MHIQLFFSAIILGLLFNDVVYAQNGIVCKDKESKFVACKNDEDCVGTHLCKNGSVITDGFDLLTKRIGETDDSQCDTCNFRICCKVPSKKSKPSITPTKLNKIDKSVNKCGYLKKKNVVKRGILENRILGGSEAEIGQFPWVVAILNHSKLYGEATNIYMCGATLIHPSVVLTVAHCVENFDPKTMVVRAGELDLKKVDETAPHQDRLVRKVITHKDYVQGNLFNDIALLFLKDAFQIEEPYNNVGWICIPKQEQTFVGETCTVSGFGKTSEGGMYPTNLSAAMVPIRDQDDCSNRLKETRLGEYFELNERFICAGGEEGVDACEGDAGSPLSCPSQDRFCLSGLVSWGIGCGQAGVPGVYTNVAYYREWIDKNMSDENLVPLYKIED